MHIKKIITLSTAVLSSLVILTAVNISPYAASGIAHSQTIDEIEEPTSTAPISYDQLSKKERREVECLAKNIYYEAASESKSGWAAIAAVTMNRVMTGNYAETVCGVVYQKTGTTYQFSWVGMRNKMSKINETIYNEIVTFAIPMYLDYNHTKDVTKGSTFYHADYVKPGWRLQRVKKIGRHVFYRSTKDYNNLKA